MQTLYSHTPNTTKQLLGSNYQRLTTLKTIRLADARLVKSFRDMYILKLRYGVDAYYIPDDIDKTCLKALPTTSPSLRNSSSKTLNTHSSTEVD